MRHIGETVTKHALKVAAAILLVVAVVLAVFDRVAAGSLVAGLFVVVTLFHYLPEMESFKAYGVEAKLRARLSEADQIIRMLKQTMLASAQLTYHTLGWGSRFGGATAKGKQAIADATDAALQSVGVEASEISALKSEYIFFAKYDIFQSFDEIVRARINMVISQIGDRLRGVPEGDPTPQNVDLRAHLDALRNERKKIDLLEVLPTANFRELCLSRIPTELPEDDFRTLGEFASKVGDIVQACEKSGRVTEEAAELIDALTRGKESAVYGRLFPGTSAN